MDAIVPLKSFLSFISMKKRIKFFWIAGFFLPAINATVFRNISRNRSENKNFVNQLWSVSLSLPRNEKRGFRKTSNNWEMGANCCVEYFSECFTCNQKLSSQNCGVSTQFLGNNFLFLLKKKTNSSLTNWSCMYTVGLYAAFFTL